MGKTISVCNEKGGVGKTAVCLNLGAALRERGKKVLLVDLDPQASLTIALQINVQSLSSSIYDVLVSDVDPKTTVVNKNGVSILPSTIDLSAAEVELQTEPGRDQVLKEKIATLAHNYDYTLIDCPPSLGLLTINALTASDGVIIPVQTHYLSMRGMQLLLRTIKKVQSRTNPALVVAGILPTFYDGRTLHSKEVLEELRTYYTDQLIDPPIRYRTAISDAISQGQSVLEYSPRSDVAEAFRKVAEVIDRA